MGKSTIPANQGVRVFGSFCYIEENREQIRKYFPPAQNAKLSIERSAKLVSGFQVKFAASILYYSIIE